MVILIIIVNDNERRVTWIQYEMASAAKFRDENKKRKKNNIFPGAVTDIA